MNEEPKNLNQFSDLSLIFVTDGKMTYRRYEGGESGTTFTETLTHNALALLIHGEAYLTVNGERRAVAEDSICTLAHDLDIKVDMMPRAIVFVFLFDYLCPACDSLLSEYEERNDVALDHNFKVIPMNSTSKAFANLITSFSYGIISPTLLRMKLFELCFILKESMDMCELYDFFGPVHSCYGHRFRTVLVDNIDKIYSVKDMAKLCGYSMTRFYLKFKSVFKQTPGAWLNKINKQRLVDIIKDPTLSFADMALILRMASVQQFSRFCRNNFGCTPTQLREKVMKRDAEVSIDKISV